MNAPVPASQFEERASYTSAVVPRATVEVLVRQRDEALVKYEKAHAAMAAAHDCLLSAHEAGRAIRGKVSASDLDRYTYHLHGEKVAFMRVVDPQKRDDYMAIARKIV